MNSFLLNEEALIQNLKSLIPSSSHLSRREAQCFYLLAFGGTMKTIARMLGLSPRTVEMYLNKIKVKTGLPYKSDLTQKAAELLMPH